MVALFSSSNLEPFLVEVQRHLCGEKVQEEDSKLRRKIRRTYNSFLKWNDELFRRTPLGPKIFLPKLLRLHALDTFYDRIGHWNVETSRKFVVDGYWWPGVTGDV